MPLNKCFPCFQTQDQEVVTKLDCSNTILTDVFPDVWQHERTLEELYLNSTRIYNLPPQLFYCQSLRVLAVNNNNLESIPNAIGSLRQLEHLNLSRNLISNIPEQIKMCKNLKHLDLSCNNLHRLPEAITSLISLQELLLNETCLEFLPANFGRLVNLRILEMRLNSLITLPKSMMRLKNLQRIDIGGNEFTELPEVVGELKQMRELWIDLNQIKRIYPNVSNLRELLHLEVNGNFLETLPNEVSNWRNVEVLSLCTNNLESLPFSIGMMKQLVTLKCESNYLGELPESISNLENLEELVLSKNRIYRLPATIGRLRKLRYLFIDNNEIRSLPEEICSCANLRVLSVSHNRLTELPQNIGHLNLLKVLNLVHNFVDSLPVSVLSLVNLTSLWINDNQSQPLVPLQYLDTSTKMKLTCFMLPQNGTSPEVRGVTKGLNFDLQLSEMPVYSENLSEALTDRQLKPLYPSNIATSPRRICFAAEATILTEPLSGVGKSSPMCEEELGVRLMRSPTPYPKDLRSMATLIRQHQQTTETYAVGTIKEARISSAKTNKGAISPKTNKKEINFNCNEISLASANSAAGINVNMQQLPPIVATFESKMGPNQNILYKCSDASAHFITDTMHEQLHKKYHEPPPYHIACAHTKMSLKDLSNYDSMRQYQNLSDSFDGDSIFIEDSEPTTSAKLNTYVMEPNSNSTIPNTSEKMSALYDFENGLVKDREHSPHVLEDHSNPQSKYTQVQNDNLPPKLPNRYMSQFSQNSNNAAPQNHFGKKSTWLFGVHKNPTVKQVTIKRENGSIGFDIAKMSNKEGICVFSIVENTNAARLLCVQDKLLEIDGHDCTAISLAEVNRILDSTGAIVNIMISRK